MDREQWAALIRPPFGDPEPVSVVNFVEVFNTSSRPALADANDGHQYVIKGMQRGREIVNELVIAEIGQAMNAPIPRGEVVQLDQAFIYAFPELLHFQPGYCYGSRFISGCTGRLSIRHIDREENGDRFARLVVLYGLTYVTPSVGDYNLMYTEPEPHLVFSFDHAKFFPDGPDWTSDSLEQVGPATINVDLAAQESLTPEHLEAALHDLRQVTDEQIARAVSLPPGRWNCDANERTALAMYLARRRDELTGLDTRH